MDTKLMTIPSKDEVILLRIIFNYYTKADAPHCTSMLTLDNLNKALTMYESFYNIPTETRCAWCLKLISDKQENTVYSRGKNFHGDCFSDYIDHYKD